MLIRDYMRSLAGMAATVVMDPTVAGLLKDAHGFKTKAELGQWLAKNVEVAAGTFWGNGVNTTATIAAGVSGTGTLCNMDKRRLLKR